MGEEAGWGEPEPGAWEEPEAWDTAGLSWLTSATAISVRVAGSTMLRRLCSGRLYTSHAQQSESATVSHAQSVSQCK